MITGSEMAAEFERNTRILKRNLTEVTEQKSRIRQSGGGNSVNWLVGHMLRSRLNMLNLLGAEADELAASLEPYRRARDGGYRDEELMTLEDLIVQWDRVQDLLGAALDSADMSGDGGEHGTLGQAVMFYNFHEAYHLGQAGILRRVMGLKGTIR